MAIRGAKSVAEYAIRRWLVEQGFLMENFELTMDGKEGKLTDRQGVYRTIRYTYDGNRR